MKQAFLLLDYLGSYLEFNGQCYDNLYNLLSVST